MLNGCADGWQRPRREIPARKKGAQRSAEPDGPLLIALPAGFRLSMNPSLNFASPFGLRS